jgi:hypothetical protein
VAAPPPWHNNSIRKYRRSDINLYRLRASLDARSAKISSAIKIAFEAKTILGKDMFLEMD